MEVSREKNRICRRALTPLRHRGTANETVCRDRGMQEGVIGSLKKKDISQKKMVQNNAVYGTIYSQLN